MYENFNASSLESLDSIFTRLQKIVGQLAILGENISQEDLNFKFLRSLPSEWSMHVMVWRHKPDLGSIINTTNVHVSTASSTNDVNTSNVHVSTTSSSLSTASTTDNTARLSDAIIYAFLANQPNWSQVVHEDLEQIHEDDLEEMDLKWQLALLSMKGRKFYQRTRKKIIINGSDTAGYDKTKVECFNCHKIGHFARECRNPWSQENKSRNQDNSRRTVNVEESSSKAMLAIYGVGFDWSFMTEEEIPTNFALMAFSDSEVHNNKTCSKTCLKIFEDLKSQYENFRIELNKSEFDLANYKRGLASVEEQLVFYKKNEGMLCDQIAVLKRDASFNESKINALKIQIERLKKEKESNQIKIDNFENASKSLDKLIRCQISDNNRKGMGYNVVAPPPTGLFAPPTIDLLNSGLEEFKQPEFEGYGVKVNKSVSENSSKEIKKTSDGTKPVLNNVKKETCQREVRPVWNNAMRTNHQNFSNSKRNFGPTAVLTKSGLVPISTARQSSSRAATSISTVRPIKTVAPKSFVNSVNTVKGKRVTSVVGEQEINAVKSKACWVWRPKIKVLNHVSKNNETYICKQFDYVDPTGLEFKVLVVYHTTNGHQFTMSNRQERIGYSRANDNCLVVPLTKVGDEAVHKELGDRMERVATTASSFETEQDSDAQTRFEAASKSPMIHLSQEFDQERKEADDIDWSKIVEQAQERQSGSMIRYQALKKKLVIVAQASGSEPFQEQSTEEPKELSEEDLTEILEIVPIEETKAEGDQHDQYEQKNTNENQFIDKLTKLKMFTSLNYYPLQMEDTSAYDPIPMLFNKGGIWHFARLEAIRIFLAFATYINFIVYQMDVKSIFLNGKKKFMSNNPQVLRCSEFLNHVYKLDKALYGLKQAPTTWYETLSTYLTEHNFVRAQRYQANPKESQLIVVKRTFCTLSLGLQYLKRSGFDLKGYLDSNYAGCNMDRKSTSAEAKDAAAAGCCANILWIKSQLTEYDIIYEKIKNHTLKRDIEFHFIPTQYQLTDIFIKLLDKPSFKRLIDELGMLNIESKPEASVVTKEN
ncbi:ribonuclease H-like domain-containing protein [Tanacetum coccineum]